MTKWNYEQTKPSDGDIYIFNERLEILKYRYIYLTILDSERSFARWKSREFLLIPDVITNCVSHLYISMVRKLLGILVHPKRSTHRSWSPPKRYRSCLIWSTRCFSCTVPILFVRWSWSVCYHPDSLLDLPSICTEKFFIRYYYIQYLRYSFRYRPIICINKNYP